MRHSLKMRLLLVSVLALVGLSVTRLITAPLPNVFLQKFISDIDYWVTNERGEVIYSKSPRPLPIAWDPSRLPQIEGEMIITPTSSKTNFTSVVRLNPEGTRFRVLQKRSSAFSIVVLSLLIFLRGLVVWGTPVAFAGFIYFRRRAKAAQRVLEQLKKGNLSARFPLGPLDGVGLLMQQFNSMADELEKMMGRLRQAEASRGELLKELAHDLQTPLTSLSFYIESVSDGAGTMSTQAIQTKMTAATHEMGYFKRLLEDLFLLERANEIHRDGHEKTVDLGEQILLETRQSNEDSNRVRIEVEPSSRIYLIDGSPQLLRRLVRNALENALRFARSRVWVALHGDRGQVRLSLRDDGPGFSPEGLQAYGKKSPTRLLDLSGGEGRISLGLGSVIIRRIVEIHGGTIHIQNWHKSDGSLGGAELEIYLPALIRVVPGAQAA